MRLTPSFVDGFLLAFNMAPDLVAVIDSHRCEMERVYFLEALHDRNSTILGPGPYSHQRRLYPVNWDGVSEAAGTEDKVRQVVRETARRHPGQPIILLRGFLSQFIHTDIHGIAASMSEEIGVPMVAIEQASVDDDWIDGWQRAQETFLGLMLSPEGDVCSIATGFPVLRREGDELGNLEEMDRLFGALDLPSPFWALSGAPLAPLGRVSPESTRFVFPYDPDLDAETAWGDRVALPLPLGIEGTADFLRRLGQKFGVEEEARELVDRARTDLRERLLPVVERSLIGTGAVVVGDPVRVEGLVSALSELGISVSLALILRREGWEGPEMERLKAAGVETWVDPPLNEVGPTLMDGADGGRYEIMVGSALFTDAARDAGLATVEVGFPYSFQHFLRPHPVVGFSGVLELAERVDNAVAARRQSRTPSL